MIVSVKSLVGSSGVVIDQRRRTPDGSLFYGEEISGHHPILVTLTGVEWRELSNREKTRGLEGRWLVMTWEHNSRLPCNYSGCLDPLSQNSWFVDVIGDTGARSPSKPRQDQEVAP